MGYGFTITCNKCKSTEVKVYYTNDDDGLHFECMGCDNSWDEDFELFRIGEN